MIGVAAMPALPDNKDVGSMSGTIENQTPEYMPTPEEIEEAKRQIREEWGKDRKPRPQSRQVYGRAYRLHRVDSDEAVE